MPLQHKRVLRPISTNVRNVIGAIVSQTIPRIITRLQKVEEVFVGSHSVEKCAALIAMVVHQRCFAQKFVGIAVARVGHIFR